MYAPFSIAP